MVSSRAAIYALTALAAGSIALAPLPFSGASSNSISFETPTIVDPIHTNGEPDIAIDPQGRVFNSGPTGTGTQRSTWFGSVDGGHTFRVMAQKTVPTAIMGIPAPGPGGGDTDIAFDRSGKQYFSDLWALACHRVAVTGPTLLVYLVWNSLAGPGPNAGEQWNKSTDGVNYTNATAGEVPNGAGVVYSPFGGDGYPAIDQVTGKVFQAAACDASRCGTSATATPGLYMNIGTPDSTGTLHFLDDAGGGNQDLKRLVKIADTPAGSPDTL